MTVQPEDPATTPKSRWTKILAAIAACTALVAGLATFSDSLVKLYNNVVRPMITTAPPVPNELVVRDARAMGSEMEPGAADFSMFVEFVAEKKGNEPLWCRGQLEMKGVSYQSRYAVGNKDDGPMHFEKASGHQLENFQFQPRMADYSSAGRFRLHCGTWISGWFDVSIPPVVVRRQKR